jgi:CRISPR-associated protein Cmr5
MANEKSRMKTIEQGRASQVYDAVQKIYQETSGKGKKWDNYKAGVKKLPVLIKTNGLGQALAFIYNRDNFPDIYEQIEIWLQENDFKQLVPKDRGKFIEKIVNMDSEQYRQATVETLALLNGMRRFVDGIKS